MIITTRGTIKTNSTTRIPQVIMTTTKDTISTTRVTKIKLMIKIPCTILSLSKQHQPLRGHRMRIIRGPHQVDYQQTRAIWWKLTCQQMMVTWNSVFKNKLWRRRHLVTITSIQSEAKTLWGQLNACEDSQTLWLSTNVWWNDSQVFTFLQFHQRRRTKKVRQLWKKEDISWISFWRNVAVCLILSQAWKCKPSCAQLVTWIKLLPNFIESRQQSFWQFTEPPSEFQR